MSIETNLASIAESLKTIAAKMGDERRTEVQPLPAPAPAAAPAVPTAAPTPTPAAAALAAMPTFVMTPAAPAAAPAAPAVPAPFNDQKSLMAYVMDKYRKLGPVKGGLIQNALSELGLHNINDLKPEHYGSFYAKVEAIV